MLNLQEQAHRRWNPLTREWVVVSPYRTQRPWQGQVERVAAREEIACVRRFEIRGALRGARNPHPHGQIWEAAHVPNEPAKETVSLAEYRDRHSQCLLCDYLSIEGQARERIVFESPHFVA